MKRVLKNVYATTTYIRYTVNDIAELLKKVDELKNVPITATIDKDGFDILRIGKNDYSLKKRNI